MSTVVQNLDTLLNDFGRRIQRLEQMITSPDVVGGSNNFDEIVLDDGVHPVVYIKPVAPDVPTLTAAQIVPGAFFDVIFMDVSWTPAATGETAVSYTLEVAKKVGTNQYELAQVFTTYGTSQRVEPLEPNTTYAFRVSAIGRLGLISATTAWVEKSTGEDTTAPPAVSNLVVGRGATSVVVRFDALTEAQAWDVALGRGIYEIQIDTSTAFNTANLKVTRTTANVVAFNDIVTQGTWYARVAAIDSSGNQGPWTVSGAATAGGVIDNMIVSGLDAAKITFGEMSGDRITANTLTAGKLTTSSLTSADITLAGGSLRAGSPPTTGLLINSQGIRLYGGGVANVVLDAATGNATFKGNIDASSITSTSISSSDISGGTITGVLITGGTFRTAASGQRIEINSSGFNNQIVMYTGYASEYSPATIAGSSVSGTIQINSGRVSAGGSVSYLALAATQAGMNSGDYYVRVNASGTYTVDVYNTMRVQGLLTAAGGIDTGAQTIQTTGTIYAGTFSGTINGSNVSGAVAAANSYTGADNTISGNKIISIPSGKLFDSGVAAAINISGKANTAGTADFANAYSGADSTISGAKIASLGSSKIFDDGTYASCNIVGSSGSVRGSVFTSQISNNLGSGSVTMNISGSATTAFQAAYLTVDNRHFAYSSNSFGATVFFYYSQGAVYIGGEVLS